MGGGAVECAKVLPESQCDEQHRNQGAGRREEQSRGIYRARAGLSVTWNSLLSLRLLIDVRKDVNFMKSQSELAQKRNDPGSEMQNFKDSIHPFWCFSRT